MGSAARRCDRACWSQARCSAGVISRSAIVVPPTRALSRGRAVGESARCLGISQATPAMPATPGTSA